MLYTTSTIQDNDDLFLERKQFLPLKIDPKMASLIEWQTIETYTHITHIHTVMTPSLLLLAEHMLTSALVARYGPTRKCGIANTSDPRPISAMPPPIHRGFDAPARPPKYVTGTKQRNEAMSYPLATRPVCDERNPNRRSMVVMTTLMHPFTSNPENKQGIIFNALLIASKCSSVDTISKWRMTTTTTKKQAMIVFFWVSFRRSPMVQIIAALVSNFHWST